jgi:hypothetical protein
MSRKLFAVSFFAALAIGILLLFGLSGDVSATTIKLNYSTAADCGGADDNEATTADNSCSTAGLGGRALGATADVETVFDIKVGHSNYANTRTVLAAPPFNIALDSAIPNGAFIGNLTTTATLSLLNAPCVAPVPITIPFFDASTDIANTIDWTGTGVNLTQDSDGNGLADGIDKYPSFLNIMFNGQKPLARYYGYTNATSGAPPTQLNFVIFAAGVLQGTTNPGMPRPDQEMNSSLGYINYVALNNPAPGQPAAPSTISDICTPLNVTTRLLGKTAGEGRSIAAVGNGELSASCRGAAVGVDDDADTVADDGCIVVNDACGNGVDNDADTKIDEYCVNATGLYAARARSTNPTSATSGIYDTGTQLAGAYLQGGRDADNDGIENPLDSCPVNADGRESGAACAPGNVADEDTDGAVNDGCPRIGTAENFPSPNQCTGSTDEDGDGSANDGCPAIQLDTNANGVGDACETAGNCTPADNDCDNDTFENRQDNCPVNANADQLDTDSNRCNDAVNNDAGDEATPIRINDGCPAVGAAETACTDAVDSDGDTVVNDGCPLRGGISEFAVVATDPNVGVNDGCPASGAAEAGADCTNNTDDDADTVVNDGCPTVGARKDCDSSLPADGDCVDTGEAAACNNALDDDGDAPNDFGPASDGIGDACETGGALTSVNGDYDKDFPRVAVCIGDTDTDGDGWCDATETALGSNTASATSVPEYAGLDYPIDPAPQSCSNMQWYASSGDPIGDGASVDDDGDTQVNSADFLGCVIQKQPLCLDTVDDDGDTNVNDGCPALAAAEDPACVNAIDDDPVDDGTSTVNDGCPAKDVAENPQCANTTNDDAGDDGVINDGCPQAGLAAEAGADCTDSEDDDGDGFMNDGCPQVNATTEDQTLCTSNVDDDADTRVNDGCPIVGSLAEEPDCANNSDDDADTFANDGCPIKGVAAEDGDMDDDGVADASDNCSSVYNPDQTNSDTIAFGGGDALGDACDLNDDGDGLTDDKEWARGSDAKNPLSPFFLDLDGSTTISGGDSLALKAWINTAVANLTLPTQVCLP